MLEAANTDLLNPPVPKAHKCQKLKWVSKSAFSFTD